MSTEAGDTAVAGTALYAGVVAGQPAHRAEMTLRYFGRRRLCCDVVRLIFRVPSCFLYQLRERLTKSETDVPSGYPKQIVFYSLLFSLITN